MLEGRLAESLHAQTVSNRAGDLIRRELDQPSTLQAGSGVGCELGFDPDHSHFRTGQLDGGRDPTDEPAAADGHEHGLHVGQVFEDLRPDSALAGDNDLIVVRRHGNVAVFHRKLLRLARALCAVGADQDDRGPELRRRVELHTRCPPRH
jgi:hypothetical protein